MELTNVNFVRAFIKEEKAPVKVVRSQADLSDEQLESALMAGDVQKAKLLLLAQHNNLEPHQQLLDNLDTQRQVEEVQANLRQGDRIQLLKQRLGLQDERRSSTSKVAFLPLAETDNKSSALQQVTTMLAPQQGINKHDAAFSLRMEARGFQTRYPSVLCDVPEGLEPSLRMLDTIERLLRSGQEMSEGRSAGFAHIRTVLRNTSLNLSPLEMGYLTHGGVRMLLQNTSDFTEHFKPQTYDEGIPDSARSKVRMAAARREEYLKLLARIENTLELAKRPVVISGGAQPKNPKKQKTGPSIQHRGSGNL